MLQKLFSIRVSGKDDMARLEEVVVGLLGGEHHRCAFLRSEEFVRLRNYALYCHEKTCARSVHIEGLKIVLTSTGKACVYLTDPCVVPVPSPPSPPVGGDPSVEEEAFLVGRKRRAVTPPSHGVSEDDRSDADGECDCDS